MHEPLRVGWYTHPLRMGGVENFLLRLAGRLQSGTMEIHALFGGAGEVVDAFRAAGIDSHTFTLTDFRGGFTRLGNAMQSLGLHVVQTNMFTPLAAIAAGQAGIPHVWRVGGHVRVALRRIAPPDRTSLLQLLSSQSAAIVCNSEFAAEPLQDFAGPRPVVIRNGIASLDRDATATRQRSAAARTHTRASVPRVCMFAHFDPQKRHEDLIRAAALVVARVPGVRFFLFGSTFGETSMVRYRDELHALIDSLALDGIVMLDHAPDADRELAQTTISVLPSVDESSSNAILEAMARRIPVIAADSGGHREMIDDGRSGLLVAPRDPHRLAAAILRMLEDPAWADQLADRARTQVMIRYSMDACARSYDELYRRCAGRG